MTIFLDCPRCLGVLTVQISERGIRCRCGEVIDRAIDRGDGRLVPIRGPRCRARRLLCQPHHA